MTWQIWLAIASIVFIVFGLVKRLETRMLLIVAGFILCCASGAPMKAFGAFVKGMTNITLVPAICSAMGFAFAVQASKCDQHLVAAVAAPLKKLGGLLIPAATILTFLINIAIMSAAGTAATAGATFIPLLLRAGIRPAAAAAADVPTWRRPAAPTAAKSAKRLRQFAKRYNFRHKNPGCPGFFVYRFISDTENH